MSKIVKLRVAIARKEAELFKQHNGDLEQVSAGLAAAFPRFPEEVNNRLLKRTRAAFDDDTPAYYTHTVTRPDGTEKDKGRFYDCDIERPKTLKRELGLSECDMYNIRTKAGTIPGNVAETFDVKHIYDLDPEEITRERDNEIARSLFRVLCGFEFNRIAELAGLRGKHRKVFYLWARRNLDPEEIGAVLSLDPATVSHHLDRALEKIEGLPEADHELFGFWTVIYETFGNAGLCELIECHRKHSRNNSAEKLHSSTPPDGFILGRRMTA